MRNSIIFVKLGIHLKPFLHLQFAKLDFTYLYFPVLKLKCLIGKPYSQIFN